MTDRTFVTSLRARDRRNFITQWLHNYAEVIRVLAFIGLHIPLGLLLIQSPLFSDAHAGLTLLVGLCWVALSAPLERIAYVGAYLTGAETLWRMTKADLPWEFGKYAVTTVLVLALLRKGCLRGPILPFFFFILLLPSLILPLTNVEDTEFRQQISFNLSGPLALMVCTWFFSNVKLSVTQLHHLFLALIGPVISVATITLYGIATAKDLVFTDDSNLALSGGFGPNQVSTILSLGALAAFLWALTGRVAYILKVILLVITLFLLAQSALTFSRSGLYLAAGGAAFAIPFLIRDRRTRLQLAAGLVLLGVLITFILLPRLDDFTEGALSKRFSDTRLTGRDTIALADIEIFAEHPVFGVGPGQTRYYRRGYDPHYLGLTAHTEFTRLLSEHGFFGLIAIAVLIVIGVQNFYYARSAGGKGLAGALMVWSLLYMLVCAMRLVAPSFIFGLPATALALDDEDNQILRRDLGETGYEG